MAGESFPAVARAVHAVEAAETSAPTAGADVDGKAPAASAASRFIRGGEFVFDVPDTPPSVWGEAEESLWQSGEPFIIAAPPGVGKTTLAGQLVQARIGLGSGRLLGYPVQPAPAKVLYVAADRPNQIARSFRRMLDEETRETVDAKLEFWRGPLPFDIGREPDRLAEFVLDRGASDLFIDSLKDVATDLSKDETGSRVNRAIQSCIAAEIEVCMLHHQRKAGDGNRKPKSLDDLYGSTWIAAGAGSVVLLWGQAGNSVVELSHLKPPAEVVGPFDVLHDFTSGTSIRCAEKDAFDVLRDLGRASVKDVATALFESPDRNEIERSRRQLDKLVTKGFATKQDSVAKEPAIYVYVGGSK